MLGAAALLTSFVLAGFTRTATGPAGGQVLAGTFPGTSRAGFVYLPPGFDSLKHYPVVYLLHGMPGSPSEYLYGTELVQFADGQIATHTLRPFIAVAPAAGARRQYNGEWAGPWEDALVDRVIPWVDVNLPTIASARGRVIAGLSAGGFGAIDIAVRHPGLFAAAESWSGYFSPLHDGSLKDATREELAAHDPTTLVRAERRRLRHDGLRFFVSSGPSHSHWFKEGQTVAFARELRGLGLPVELRVFPNLRGEWRNQLNAGLSWALG